MLPSFLAPSWRGFLTFILLMEGFTFLCPGGTGGGYNDHLRHFVTPPPAEDIKGCPPLESCFFHVPLWRADCVVMSLRGSAAIEAISCP